MIEKIKERIWSLLKDKEISLAMIFSASGEILWHRGRAIADTRTIGRGCGYCSTPIQQALHAKKTLRRESCSAAYPGMQGLDSARQLNIKSLAILPLIDPYFLYLDSGIRDGFSGQDIAIFETLGALLGGIIQDLRSGGSGGKSIAGTSPLAAAIREKVVKYAIEEDPVLLLGETGVGKSHVAEMIHLCSGRSGPFVVVNTPGIPDTLIESQLFGHRKGAFSGAVSDNEGFVTAASGGTLLLDEIAELEPPLQAKLLRFIDTKMFHRLGESRERRADVRIIASTNQDLVLAMADKTFREDLFFRLNCLTIELPPLRLRREDIPLLISENRNLLRGKSLSAEAQKILLEYDWPGNIRELLQALKVAGIHCEGQVVGPEIADLLKFRKRQARTEADKIDRAWEALRSGNSFWDAVKEPYLRRDLSRDEVREIIARGLQRTNGKFIGLLRLFNLPRGEYKNFMRFLYANKLK